MSLFLGPVFKSSNLCAAWHDVGLNFPFPSCQTSFDFFSNIHAATKPAAILAKRTAERMEKKTENFLR